MYSSHYSVSNEKGLSLVKVADIYLKLQLVVHHYIT